MKKEIAVIFKRKELKNEMITLIPQKVIVGTLNKEDYTFTDEHGKKYQHIIFGDIKNGFGLRTSVKDLNSIYKVSNLKELLTTYFKHIKEYNYYFSVLPEALKREVELNDLILIAEDKKYHHYLKLEDNDLKVIAETLKKEEENRLNINIDTNKLIKTVKDKIISQDEAIEQIVSILWQNYRSKRKSNMLLIGPTGTGKTEIIRLIAKELDIPIVIANAASLTQSGYIGESVDDILKNLINISNGNIKKAERGIVVLDELDKLANNKSSNETIATTGVQDELLKLVEDGTYYLKMGDLLEEKTICINTKDITFIGVGAFQDLKEKNVPDKVIGGFSKSTKNTSQENTTKITNDRLINYGLKPELVGRLANIIILNSLTKEDLIKIMKNPNNDTINEKLRILANLNIKATINDNVYEQLADIAIKKNIGARGIVNSVEILFNNAMLEISKNTDAYQELILTEETIKNPKKYTLVRKKEGKGN